MEFLFYIVACFGIIAVTVPLFSIATSLGRLASTVETEEHTDRERARVRTN
jgi:hypothetical protein